LFGAQFNTHPPQFTFTVVPRPEAHPVTEGIGSFEVHDEFYLHHCQDTIEVLMTAELEDKTKPMVWTRAEEKGKVAYIAMGHDPKVWSLPPYMQLIHQALNWLVN
jgi:type 1 glutamine amidotransferase